MRRTLLALLLPLLAACAGTGQAPPAAPAAAPDAGVEVTLLHFNDVYEITPLEEGRVGGLARVATLRKRLLAENPHTLTVLAGDLFSPSAMGTAEVDGKALDGRQMVAVLNEIGLDWTTFGNHEFDVPQEAFLERLGESRFGWVSGNVTAAGGAPFPGVEPWTVVTFGGPGGASVRVGLLGATIRSNDPEWVAIADPLETLATQARELRPRVDALVALTHLDLEQDVEIAETVPEIDLILGGHEHENWAFHRGADLTPVFKADSNVRTVYVVELRYDPATAAVSIEPTLVPVTEAIPEDPETAAEVERWVDLAFAAFRKDGFEPEARVATVSEALDGRSSVVRDQANGLTELIASSMLRAAPEAEAAVFNSGAIRIDDVLPAGPVTQYDVLRILPFGGEVVEVEIAGGLLRQVLDQGVANRGLGGFLQHGNIAHGDDGAWTVAGQSLSPARTYRVALNDYMLEGEETGLGYLMPGHPDLQILGERGDVRKALIAELAAGDP